MVRTAITIIFLLLSVLMPTQTSAHKIEVPAQKEGDYYILYVKDIPLADSVKIYGQPTFGQDGKHYGGKNEKYFKDNYAQANRDTTELKVRRDQSGIFFKYPVKEDIDSIVINLVAAEYRNGEGWFPKKGSKDLSIVWRFGKKPDTTVDDILTTAQADTITANNDEGEAATTAPSPWHISNIDWVLFVLIVLLVFAALFVNKQPQKKNEDKANAADAPRSEIATLKIQIADLTTINNNFTKEINDLVHRYNALESEMRKLQKKDRRVNTDNSSENIQVSRQMPPAQPINLGSAEHVAGEKALAINRSGAGFFQLIRNMDGQVSFTLIDNPEVRNFFETNSSMLGIYKNDGIISYDNIPNNSHVSVESKGIAKEIGSGKFEVLTPLKLIFK